MVNRLQIVLVIVALAFADKASAQYDPLYSHYYDVETSFNPAAAGKESKLNINIAYAMDMSGFENNPQTAYASADMPFRFANAIHGVGAQFQNDKIGLFNHMRIAVQYAYKKKLFGGVLSAGLQAGLVTEKFEGSKVDIEGNDPVFTKQDVDGNTFDLGVGLYYSRKRWYAGVSAQHLTAPTVKLGLVNELKIDPMFYVTGGYDFQFRNPRLMLKTSAIGRSDGVTYRGDITGRLVYTNEQKMFYGGLTYSPTISFTILAGIRVKGVVFSYGYERYTSVTSVGSGSHELHIGYQMDVNLNKKGKNLHKAVRIL